MTYKEFISKPKTERDEILNELKEVGDLGSPLFNVVYGHLHYEHKEYHFKFNNKALAQKVAGMSPTERYNLLIAIP